MLKRLIIHPFAFAIFPILALLSNNITEVTPRVALRSTIISLAATLVLLLVIGLISRSWQKAALITTCFLVLFFSYGQVYEFLQQHPILGFSFGRHRYLVIIFCLIFIAGLWFILHIKDLANTTQLLNILGMLLLVFPTFHIASYSIRVSINEQRSADISPIDSPLSIINTQDRPDVYFIILDTYTRQDALLSDFGFDNSPFVNSLRDMGFFVADCSRSNYEKTHGSVAATLNMEYLPELNKDMATQELNVADIGLLIDHSQVRKLLESIGYKTVAFDSGFAWMRLSDADVYLRYTGSPPEMQVLQPFEAMLIRTTGLLVWSDSTYKSLPEVTQNPFTGINYLFEDHINRERFILDELPLLASFPGPKFVFVHILIPHIPYIFEPGGEIATDPGFYSSYGSNGPADEEHLVKGYINQIQFVNSRMVDILHTLVTKSAVPPIIVLMGDHGLRNENRLENLSAYYLPGDGKQSLYSTITPVNSFRLIFDTYFGTHFDLLPDISYDESGLPSPETSPDCILK